MHASARRLSVLAFALTSAAALAAQAGPVANLDNVTWSLASPGGVGTFQATVSNSGDAAIPAGKLYVMAKAPTGNSPQAATGKIAPAATGTVALAPTLNGACYTISLAIDPDSAAAGIKINPKAASRKVCLDPDGKGIVK
jgi:hypothetical protein